MGYKVDLTGVELKSFDPVPEGRYKAEVSDLVYTAESKRSGKPKMQFTFNLVGPADAATVEVLNAAGLDVSKRKAFYEISLQEASLWNVKRTLVALGDRPEDLDNEVDIDKEDYVGRECILVMGVEDYQGTLRQRTRRVEPVAIATKAKK